MEFLINAQLTRMMMTLLFFGIALFGLFTLYSMGNSRSDQDPLSDFMNDKKKKYR